MEEFVTAVEAKEEGEEGNEEGWIEFKQDGVVCRAKRPSPGQVAYLTAAMHKRASMDTQIAGSINFVMSIMDDETASHLTDRLLDVSDPFELKEIEIIIKYLITKWSGKDTDESPDSSPSAPSSGPSSTPTTPPSTYSPYGSIPTSTTSMPG